MCVCVCVCVRARVALCVCTPILCPNIFVELYIFILMNPCPGTPWYTEMIIHIEFFSWRFFSFIWWTLSSVHHDIQKWLCTQKTLFTTWDSWQLRRAGPTVVPNDIYTQNVFSVDRMCSLTTWDSCELSKAGPTIVLNGFISNATPVPSLFCSKNCSKN